MVHLGEILTALSCVQRPNKSCSNPLLQAAELGGCVALMRTLFSVISLSARHQLSRV